MASNKYYITAGLAASKDDAVTPTAGKNTYYVTAGLPQVAKAGGATAAGATSGTDIATYVDSLGASAAGATSGADVYSGAGFLAAWYLITKAKR